MVYNVVLVVPALFNVAVEMNLDSLLRYLLEPNLAAGQPEVGQLRLPAVHQLLAEDAVFIAQGVTDRRIALRGQTVEEARGQTAQAAVAKTRVRLLLIEIVQLDAHLRESLAEIGFQPEVEQVIFERTAHQKLHAEIIDLLGVGFFRIHLRLRAALAEQIGDDQRDSLVVVFVGRILRADPEVMLQAAFNFLLDLADRHCVIHNSQPPSRVPPPGSGKRSGPRAAFFFQNQFV